jgi:hypothetical protein
MFSYLVKYEVWGCIGILISVRTHQNGVYCFLQPFKLTAASNNIHPFSGKMKLFLGTTICLITFLLYLVHLFPYWYVSPYVNTSSELNISCQKKIVVSSVKPYVWRHKSYCFKIRQFHQWNCKITRKLNHIMLLHPHIGIQPPEMLITW